MSDASDAHERALREKGCAVCKLEIGDHQSVSYGASIAVHGACSRKPDEWPLVHCSGCAFERKVKVWFSWDYEKGEFREHYNKMCGACALEDRAAGHRDMALMFEKRAAVIRKRRGMAFLRRAK